MSPNSAEREHAHHQQRHEPEDGAVGERRRHLRGVVLARARGCSGAPGRRVKRSEALRPAQLRHGVADQPLEVRLEPNQRVHARDYRPARGLAPRPGASIGPDPGEPAPPRSPHPLATPRPSSCRAGVASTGRAIAGVYAMKPLDARARSRRARAARPRPRALDERPRRAGRGAPARRDRRRRPALPGGNAARAGRRGARAHARGAAPCRDRGRARVASLASAPGAQPRRRAPACRRSSRLYAALPRARRRAASPTRSRS